MKNEVKTRVRGAYIWLRKTVNGERIELSSGLPNTKQNLAYLSKNAETVFLDKYNEKFGDKTATTSALGSQTPKTGSLTFREYGEYVLSIRSKGRTKPQTQEIYQKSFVALCEYFGDMDIADIKTSTIEKWQTDTLQKYSPATINRKFRCVLSQVLEMAEADEIIRRNPLSKVSTLEMPKKKPNAYNAQEVQRLLAVCDDETFRDFIIIAVFTGMRAGELIGLKWKHIDLDSDVITVCEQTITNGKLQGQTQSVKSGNERYVEILPSCKDALKRQRLRTGLHEYVFLNQYGKPYMEEQSIRIKLQSLYAKAGLKRGTLHDLRKTYATLMLQSGQSEAFIKQNAGHVDFGVTEKHYLGRLKADREKIEKLLAG